MPDHLKLPLLQESIVSADGTTYAMSISASGERSLVVSGLTTSFTGTPQDTDQTRLCPLTPENALTLRQRLPWLQPVPLGLQVSAGFGDRLGIATPGHVLATLNTGVAPIFAQQSVRENTRTGRTPQQVVDDAMWGVFQTGWREPWGADADHMKTLTDIEPFVSAGYTFYTIDPSDYVDNEAETDNLTILQQKAARLPWQDLQSSLADTQTRYLKAFALTNQTLTFDEYSLLKALVKYGAAIAHVARMTHHLQTLLAGRPFELEMSVDETETTTALHEHFYIASELQRLQVPFVSLAPRFAGRFEKGVDYIGDLQELEQNIAGHAAIMRYFSNSYKLSLHTGSDKFGVYPLAMRHTDGLVHLKTAGTSYLEALRFIANADTSFFRTILDFARDHYEQDRKTYHVSAILAKVPTSSALSDNDLPALLDQFDARQVLHVTFGSVLDTFGQELHTFLRTRQPEYHQYIKRHFDKHLEAFRTTQ